MTTFEELSDYDFERLVADLLSAQWEVSVDTFPRGRDGGVDLRVLGPVGRPLQLRGGEELVVQCKHRPNATLAQLRSELRREASNAAASCSARYVLVTSARLTRANKNEIVTLFGGRMTAKDVLGRNDLQDLLRRHPEVERANFKLWMNSGTVLQTLLHQVEYLRSAALIEELMRLRSTYVETPILRAARDHVARQGVCILAGSPGVGKTTTAHILLLQLMASGWQPVTAVGEIRELEVQFRPEVQQALLFDDFLGQNGLQAKLQRGEDSELVRLIRAARRDQSKCLILTTRDYILKQATQIYEQLGDPVFDEAKLVLRLSALDPNLRAHILYNQLYYSPLRERAAAIPDRQRRYLALIRHRNYNPRLIQEAISAAVRESHLEFSQSGSGRLGLSIGIADPPSASAEPHPRTPGSTASPGELEVPDYLYQALEDPGRLWNHILRYQLSATQRALLLVRVSFGRPPSFLPDVYAATTAFAQMSGLTTSMMDLDAALSVLDGDLLSVSNQEKTREETLVEGLQPGVADATEAFIRSYPDIVLQLTKTATAFAQVRWLAALTGVVDERMRQSRPARMRHNRAVVNELIAAAERTLTSPQASPDDDLFNGALMPIVARRRRFRDIGQRFWLLARLYSVGDREPRRSLPDEIVPDLVAEIGDVPRDELVPLLSTLRRDMPTFWRSRRTDVEVAILRVWDAPDDADGWSVLRDILDVVPTTPEYESELSQQFDAFVTERIEDIQVRLEGDNRDGDEAEMLEELSELADRWNVMVDVDELAERAESSQASLSTDPTTDPRQAVLFDLSERSRDSISRKSSAVRSGDAIFERL